MTQRDSASEPAAGDHVGQVSENVTAELAAAVEFRCGGKAHLSFATRVEIANDTGVEVSVFDIEGLDRPQRAYAWPSEVEHDRAKGIRVVMHLPSISSPYEAVARTIGRRRR